MRWTILVRSGHSVLVMDDLISKRNLIFKSCDISVDNVHTSLIYHGVWKVEKILVLPQHPPKIGPTQYEHISKLPLLFFYRTDTDTHVSIHASGKIIMTKQLDGFDVNDIKIVLTRTFQI